MGRAVGAGEQVGFFGQFVLGETGLVAEPAHVTPEFR